MNENNERPDGTATDWRQDFMKRLEAEHDATCLNAAKCPERQEHINRDYVVDALYRIIDGHPEAQADAAGRA